MKHKIVINTEYGGFGLSYKACEWLKSQGVSIEDIEMDKLPRHDKRLVQCVEMLGEEANSNWCNLEIEEIDGDSYIIRSYDGLEYVETPDSIDWIHI